LQDDIIKGIYDSFPSLKNRLNYISNKLIEKCYIINSEDLSNSEYDELRNQGYLDNF